jgi:signal peptidase I
MQRKYWLLTGAALAFIATVFLTARSLSPLYYIPSASMEPTLLIGDRIMARPGAYARTDPKRGDLALLNLPKSLVAPGTGVGTITFVKRVVAVPGDRVEIVNGKLKRNGAFVSDPGADWTGGPPYDLKIVGGAVYSRDYLNGAPGLWSRNLVPIANQSVITRAATGAVPPKKYLVLGDNRGNANDSHVWGFADRNTFFARVAARWWPAPRSF